MTSCPVCNKPVDPIRARFVAVRAGKVVAYCSPECRDSADTKPTKVPEPAPAAAPPRPKAKTPAAGTPKAAAPKPVVEPDSGPVIEILHEPASGVVTSAKDERITKPTGKFAKAEIDEVIEVEATKTRPDGSKGSGGKDSAAVAGELTTSKRARTRPSGKHLTRERTDSTEAKAGWDWLDDEPAEHARPGTITESEKKARWPFVVLLLIAALGGGGYLVMKYALENETTKVVPDQPIDSASAAEAIDAPLAVVEPAPVVTKEAAVRQAKVVLLEAIEDGTERVQRLAAAPLGRTGDPAAVAALQKAVKQEKVAAARFKLAYALARAGDKAGREVLVAGLSLPERSDKLDAATHLAHLGDARAKPLLSSLLGVAQHKLRAAEELSRFKDPEAEKLLEQVRTDEKSSLDERATATIALFRAGKADLAADVRKLLAEKSWRVFAAYALAEVAKDETVKPELVEQVKHGVGVKVRAAYALKKLLGDQTDELVPALLEALASKKDQEQFYAAEAILILGGEPQWSEYE